MRNFFKFFLIYFLLLVPNFNYSISSSLIRSTSISKIFKTRALSQQTISTVAITKVNKSFIDKPLPFCWDYKERKELSDYIDNNLPYLSNIPKKVKIVEVGPRDGLQNEPTIYNVIQRCELIKRLCQSGLRTVEVGAFVSPKYIPQMANTDTLYKMLMEDKGIKYYKNMSSYPVLVPNEKMLEKAIETGVREISVFTSPSESFNKKNINRTVNESIKDIEQVVKKALSHGIKVRAYLSCVMGCPYEGDMQPQKVSYLAKKLLDMGCYEVSLGDTIGAGTPAMTMALLRDFLYRDIPIKKLAVHFHDTNGKALQNILTAFQYGVSVVDSSIHGLGGCPYASHGGKRATGNVATEKVAALCDYLQIETNLDIDQLAKTKIWIENELGIASSCKKELKANL